MKKILLLVIFGVFFAAPANAQQHMQALVVSACGSGVSYAVNTYGYVTILANGEICTNATGGGGGGGTSSNFGAAFPAVGTAAGAEYLVSPPTLTTGQMVALQTDVNGNLKVTGIFWPYTLGQQLAGGSVPVVLTAAQLATLTPPAAITGFATSANQATEIASLATIATNTGGAIPPQSPAVPIGGIGICDGANGTTNPCTTAATVKAASTTPVATDKPLVVAISPNCPTTVCIPTGAASDANSIPVVNAPSGSALVGIPPPVCGSAVSSCVLKAGAGNLYSVYADCTAACWLMVFNRTTAPSNGATTAGNASGNMVECISITAGSIGSIYYGLGPPAVYSVGITAVISSTACATLTLSAVGFIHGMVM